MYFEIFVWFVFLLEDSLRGKKKKKIHIFSHILPFCFSFCLFLPPRMLIDVSVSLKVSHVSKIELGPEINTASILVLGNTYFVGGNGFNFL